MALQLYILKKSMPKMKKMTGVKSVFPEIVKPMLCTLVQEPFTKEGWIYEVKWDGYRIIAFKKGNRVILHSRAGLDYSERYTAVYNAIKKMKGDFIIDGEVVAFDEEGHVSFDLVQKANPDAPIAYYAFDMLWKDGKNIMELPLAERKAKLSSTLPKTGIVKFSDSFDDGIALYNQAQNLELEGIVAKKADSIYQPGKRGNDWLKIPTAKRQEFVVGGWAESEKARAFRSLLFGAYNKDGKLEWIGRTGGGFKEKEMPEILEKLKALEIKQSPFINKVLDAKGAVIRYIKPEIVINVKFATWTTSGRIRKPATFLGIRYDKKPKNVVREVPLSEKEEQKVIEGKSEKTKPNYGKTSYDSNWRELEKMQVTSRDEIDIDGCAIELTNVEHELWKQISKADLIQYYSAVSNYILPYLKNRPLSLHVKPYAPTAPGLYIKDMEGRQPRCADIFSTPRKHPKPGKRNVIDYLVCNNKATLIYLINLGCIDINPQNSTVADYLHPDYIIIDLDPSDEDFAKAITAAQACKQMLDEYKLKAFVKTSGKTGMHLLLPCAGLTFPEARIIAVSISNEVTAMISDVATSENSIAKRGNKIFIDYNQNDEADTIASPYSCRPFHIPTVSTPLDWKEVKDGLNPHDFTINTILKRLNKKGDLWKRLFDKTTQVKNSKILKQFL